MELIGRGRGRKGQVNILKWSFISSFKNPVPKKHESHSFKHEMKGQKTCGCDYMVDPLFVNGHESTSGFFEYISLHTSKKHLYMPQNHFILSYSLISCF